MSNEMIVQPSAPMIPYADMEKMATVIAQSGLFGIKNPTQALALMLLSQAEGMHPVLAARDYHIIGGRTTLKADTMLARFQAAGGVVEWTVYTEREVTGVFSHPASPKKVPVTWTIEQANKIMQDVWVDSPQGRTKAKQALTDKDVWQQYPRAMLRARVISEGIRTVFPGVLNGMYTPEEVRDMVEVKGEAETSGPNPIEPPPPVQAKDFQAEIDAFDDEGKMRKWMIDTAQDYGWTKDTPVYISVKSACAERAAVIAANRAAKQQAEVQTVDEFEAALGPVPDVE